MTTLPASIAYLIESAANRVFRLDPDIGAELSRLNNKIFALGITDLGVDVAFSVSDSRFVVLTQVPETCDTYLSASSLAFARLAMSGSASEHFFSGDVSMRGDVEAGQRFREVLQRLDIDWEEILSQYTGDIVAHQLGNAARAFKGWSANALQTLRLNLTEYLQEETHTLPTKIEAQSFLQHVDELRQDSDRLDARVRRLHNLVKR